MSQPSEAVVLSAAEDAYAISIIVIIAAPVIASNNMKNNKNENNNDNPEHLPVEALSPIK
jgi:hypothetical protein